MVAGPPQRDSDIEAEPSVEPESPESPGKRWWRRLRPLLVVALLVGLWIAGRATGLHEQLDAERVREMVDAAGMWGIAMFVAVFAVGELLHVPGVVFVAAGVFAFGRAVGTGAVLLGALVSVTVSFLIVRWVGGQPLHKEIRWRFARRLLQRLDSRPITSVALLRMLLWMAPPLNYALAMTKVRFRDYFVGSALGLVPPVTAAALFFDWLL